MIKVNSFLFAILLIGCVSSAPNEMDELITDSDSVQIEEVEVPLPELYCNASVKVGAERTEAYFPELEGLIVGVVGNQSSMIGDVHLVDSLLNSGIQVVKVFSPEHGFRGTADAGEKVSGEVDEKTGVEIVSLYGKNKKPTKAQLSGVDVLLFDIQDVGVRFYTYISTLHYVMEAAAENSVKVIVLDRPNPNGHYVDGPVLKEGFTSFVGMHKVPVVHGMTIAEYAQMINGEKWLTSNAVCELEIVKCEGWDHSKFYELPIAPSPNLPNMTAVYLYPNLCFFEGTIVSIGRGTDHPFQVVGHPDYNLLNDSSSYHFIPQPNHGAKHPKLEGKECLGVDLHETDLREYRENPSLDLTRLFEYYDNMEKGREFFLPNNFIDLLAGTNTLRKEIIKGSSFDVVRESWVSDLEAFKLVRERYLLYP